MAISNHERVGKCLELEAGLQPFVERELKSNYHGRNGSQRRKTGERHARLIFGGTEKSPEWDIAGCCDVCGMWNDVFKKVLGPHRAQLVSELRDVRNKWAHQKHSPRTTPIARSIRWSVCSTPYPRQRRRRKSNRHKAELLRVKFDEQARHERRKVAATVLEGQTVAGLRPWREVVTPHPDVASGRYQQAEFAADLWQVYKGRASSEYGDPVEFFRRTFLAAGLKDLLVRAVRRLAAKAPTPWSNCKQISAAARHTRCWRSFIFFPGHQHKDFPGLEVVFDEAKCELAKDVAAS
jgi:hypothetical protein